MSQQFREFIILDPSESDVAEGFYQKVAYSKNGFPESTWHKRINQPQFCTHVIEYSAYESQRAVIEKLEAEISRLHRVIAKELTENDELGCEYTYVNILRADKAKLVEALKFYADNWQPYVVEGNFQNFVLNTKKANDDLACDQGELARKTLAEMDGK